MNMKMWVHIVQARNHLEYHEYSMNMKIWVHIVQARKRLKNTMTKFLMERRGHGWSTTDKILKAILLPWVWWLPGGSAGPWGLGCSWRGSGSWPRWSRGAWPTASRPAPTAALYKSMVRILISLICMLSAWPPESARGSSKGKIHLNQRKEKTWRIHSN